MLSSYSVKKPYTVVVAVIIVILLGIISFTRMTTDLLPSVDLPYVIVATTYRGASPEEVELVVSRPLEQALATTSSVEEITSISQENSSMLILEFSEGTNMDSAIIEMNGTIDMLESQWPDGISAPMLVKLNPDAMPIMVAAVDVNGMDVAQISRYTEDTVQPAIERLEGVASATAMGLLERQVEVRLDPDKVKELSDRVQASVDAKLEEARRELEDARSEIESGRRELTQQGREQTTQITQSQLDLTDGKIQIAQAEMEIASGRMQLEQVAQMAAQTVSQLEGQLEPMLAQREQLQGQIDGLREQISQLEQALELLESLGDGGLPLPSMPPAEDEDGGEENGEEDSGEGLPPLAGMDADELRSLLEEAREGLAMAEEGMTELESGITMLESNLAQARSSLAATNEQIAGLEAAAASINATKSQMGSANPQIAAGAGALASGLNEAAGQLAAAQAVVTVGENQMDAQEDTARASADLGGIITPAMVAQVISAQNFGMPAGYVTNNGEDCLVRVGDELSSLEGLEDLVLFNLGLDDIDPVKVADIGSVEMTDNADELYAKINGNDGVVLMMQKQSTYSTADVSHDIADVIAELQENNPNLHITPLMDQGVYIDLVVENVLQNLLYGAALAIIVLFAFLRSLRPTFIIAVSIPISVVFALVLMYFSGVTLNLISLAGLALGVGMLVDNSIVVIENIYRMRALGTPPKEAATEGARQVAGAIAASTLTTVCVFLPIAFTNGLSRELFVDMALTITYSLVASLLVALTLVPAMAAPLLAKPQKESTRFFRSVQQAYGKALDWALDHKTLVLVPVFALFAVCVWQAFAAGVSFMPTMDSDQMSLTVEMPPGSTFAQTEQMADTVMERVQDLPEVDTVGAMIGAGMTTMMGGSGGDSTVSMYVTLKTDRPRTSEQVAEEVRTRTDDLDCEVSVQASTMDMSAFMGSGIEVKIQGDDLDSLREAAGEVAQMLRETEGTLDVSDGLEDSSPEIRIVVDKNKAMAEGLTVAGVYSSVSSQISEGTSAGNLTLDLTDYPVMVADLGAQQKTPDELADLEVSGEVAGEERTVRLGDIADIQNATSFDTINRENQVRTVTVTASVDAAHNVGLVSRAFERELLRYHPPAGVSAKVAGENATIMEALTDMFFMLAVAVGLIYLIMVAQFQSLKSPFIVMFTIPLAYTGGLLALFMTGFDLSVIAMLGFLMLSGIIVNNGIVFVDYINQLRSEQGMELKAAIVEAGITRLRPILMTALTTILGLLTLAFGYGSGGEMLQPMAVVTIGGLIYATLLTLFVVPCLYAAMNRGRKRERRRQAEAEKPAEA
ncbi:MAG: MMPL family transporter [Clostridia bacterium]|nr:MMPL family transporter [Clostridia bacterium]